jgi:hypothetical protein
LELPGFLERTMPCGGFVQIPSGEELCAAEDELRSWSFVWGQAHLLDGL